MVSNGRNEIVVDGDVLGYTNGVFVASTDRHHNTASLVDLSSLPGDIGLLTSPLSDPSSLCADTCLSIYPVTSQSIYSVDEGTETPLETPDDP